MKVVLENTSTTTKNQPAEYAIKFYLTIGGTTTTITSDTVIASTIIDNSSLNPTLYSYNNHTPNGEKVNTNINTVYTSTGRLAAADHTKFVVGDILFTSDGASLGTVDAIQTGTGLIYLDVSTLTTAQETIILADGVYRTMNKDPLYVEVPHHIAVSYNAAGGNMNIFYDGKLVKTGTHGEGGNFSMAGSDINIGQDTSGATYTLRRRTQFMGELHEMVFLNKYKNGIASTNTLTPFYGDVLLYYDFEEENLDG